MAYDTDVEVIKDAERYRALRKFVESRSGVVVCESSRGDYYVYGGKDLDETTDKMIAGEINGDELMTGDVTD